MFNQKWGMNLNEMSATFAAVLGKVILSSCFYSNFVTENNVALDY